MTDAILETHGLSKKFGSFAAVKDVDIEIEPGETRALIGPNGAGKTTFFNMLTGGLTPTSGDVIFDGDSITGMSPEEVANRGLGRSFQITNMFESFSALDNVRIALIRHHSDGWNFYQHADSNEAYVEEATELLERVGIGHAFDETAENLSHGDQRALELAIVLALEPKMILLDEPTAGMSQVEIEELLELLDSIGDEFTLMIVEHNMDVVMSLADKIMVLHNGQEIALGTPEEIRGDEAVQEAYLGGME